MKVTVAKKEDLKVVVTVEVPVEVIDAGVNERLIKLSANAKLPGFRPGKIPMKVLIQKYGDAARHEALSDVLRSTVMDALTQENLSPAGMPQVDVKQFEKGKPLIYEATFEEFPVIDVKDLMGQEIEEISSQLTANDVNKVLENMRKQRAQWNKVARAAKNDDQVTIDFEGFIDDKAFEGGTANDMPLVLGSKTMIPGFEEGIIGAQAGDTLEVKVIFPKEYHNKEYTEKNAVFKIKVHQVSESELPALDDKFAESFGMKEGGLKALCDDLEKNMKRELKNTIVMKNKQAIINQLLKINEFKIPQALIAQETQHLKEQMLKQFGNNVKKNQLPQLPDEMFAEEAKRRVAIGLLVGSVIKKDEIKADPAQVKALIEEAAQMYKNPQEVVDWYSADKNRLSQFEMLATENQVLDKLSKQAKIVNKELAYEDVIGAH